MLILTDCIVACGVDILLGNCLYGFHCVLLCIHVDSRQFYSLGRMDLIMVFFFNDWVEKVRKAS